MNMYGFEIEIRAMSSLGNVEGFREYVRMIYANASLTH